MPAVDDQLPPVAINAPSAGGPKGNRGAAAGQRLALAMARSGRAFEAAGQAMNAFALEHIRWKIQFCLTATDEEIAEADRLFSA